MSKTRFTWDCHFSGQKRAYADTTTEGIFTIEWEPYNKPGVWEPWETISEASAKAMAQKVVGWTNEGEGDWFSTRLRTFQKVGPGSWYVFTVRAYDD